MNPKSAKSDTLLLKDGTVIIVTTIVEDHYIDTTMGWEKQGEIQSKIINRISSYSQQRLPPYLGNGFQWVHEPKRFQEHEWTNLDVFLNLLVEAK